MPAWLTALAMSLDQVYEGKAIAGVDTKLCDFIDTFLRLQTSGQYQEVNLVIDRVCGMRVNKAFAADQMNYRGQTYYFCTSECRARFAENPESYLANEAKDKELP